MKNKKRDTRKRAYGLYEGRELSLNVFKNEIFPLISTQRKECPSILPRVAKVFGLPNSKY